eukprot:216455_1
MSNQMDDVIRVVMKYVREDTNMNDDAILFEMKENDDYKTISTGGDATFGDFGNGQVLDYVCRSKISDRVAPLQFAIKISDDWTGQCRFVLNLFVKYVIDENEFNDFKIEHLISRFYSRYDFCSKYYK